MTSIIGEGNLYYFKQGAWRAVGQFSPLDLEPSLWLDASDEATIAESSGAVSQWDDKSGNGFDLSQPTGVRQPTTGTRTIAGKNVLDFDGGDQLDRLANCQLVSAVDGTFTAFAVFETDTIAAGNGFILNQDDSSPRMPQMIRRTAATIETVRIIGGIFTDATASIVTTSAPSIAVTMHRTADIEAWLNGQSDGATSTTGTNGTSPQSIEVGYRANTNYLDGCIGEIIVYPTALTNAQVNQVGTYLSSKWQISWSYL